MVRLREIPRTAAFAWSPGAAKPFLVTGTRAGAVDADFSDETKLELWDLSLDDQDQGLELQPIASINTDSRFYDIAWGPPDADHPKGIIAGALENGSVDLWDAEKLLEGASDAFMSRTTKHSGAIKSLQFNPLKPQILATAGAKGELFIYDVNDVSNPFRLGTAAARSDDLECVAWNRKVPHILATGGSGGFVTVWDLKTKKASLTLNNNRKAVSAIAWDPNNSTKLLTATPDDNNPVIFLWDLRNSNAPERTLQGHEQGVLSLSWCQQDSDLLLSCGKDNRTLLWNPQTGEQYGEFPEVTNWTFLTRFHPYNPNLSATAGFDGKITVQTLQNTNPSTTQTATETNLDGEDFFTSAQTQPQGASFTLKKAPKWLERPVGASFGFGGKLIIFKETGTPRSSKVILSSFSVDSDIGSATESFEDALKSGDIAAICDSHKSQAKTEDEKADWLVMETLVGENPRKSIIEYLGFTEEDLTNGDEGSTEKPEAEPVETAKASERAPTSRLSKHFADGDGNGDDDDDFLSNLAASKDAKTDNPFHLFSDGDTTVEKQITKALMLGGFAKAVDICLKEGRMADAFLIANCGGPELVEKVQTAYLAEKSGFPSYLRLVGSVISKNLWDVVYNADLADWKETMAVLCTFSTASDFPDLCEALGDRILEQGSRKDASLCYLVGSKLEKVVAIWIEELEESEQVGKQAGDDTAFSVHAKSLQQFIEKVTVFRHVTKFQDSEKGLSSGWKLASLYDKYTEYADIIADQGKLAVAQKYLDLLPTTYPAAEIARNRVRQATQKPVAVQPQATVRQTAAGARTTSRAQPVLGYQPSQPVASPARTFAAPATTAATNPYAPTAPNPYAPAATTSNPYAPNPGYQPPIVQPAYQPPTGFGPPPTNFGAPPRNSTPSVPPPSQAKSMDNWNDVPMVTKPPPARRATPSVAPITSPFPNQQSPTSPYGQFGSSGPTPPPPPPKGGAPPRSQGPPRVTSPLAGPPQTMHAPPPRPSSAANAYAPPPPPVGGPQLAPHAVPRVASPYNAPPAGPPPTNRYAPAPSAQPTQQMPPTVAPPTAGRPPPPNPYTAPPPQATSGPPPTGPPPRGGPPPAARAVATPPPPRAAAPPKARNGPPGDRSHIPDNARRLVEIFKADMQRVASKAPQSFAPQVKDTQKRLEILFDHLNEHELVQPSTIEQLTQLADALASKNYDVAHKIQVDIQRDKTEECGNWMVGVKRLISMSKNTP